MNDKDLKKLQDSVKDAHALIAEAKKLGVVYNPFPETTITKENLKLAKNHPKLKELRKAGMDPVVEEYEHPQMPGLLMWTIVLKGKIGWVNQDGSITELEERCSFGTLEQLGSQLQWYLDNADKYTNFVS